MQDEGRWPMGVKSDLGEMEGWGDCYYGYQPATRCECDVLCLLVTMATNLPLDVSVTCYVY